MSSQAHMAIDEEEMMVSLPCKDLFKANKG